MIDVSEIRSALSKVLRPRNFRPGPHPGVRFMHDVRVPLVSFHKASNGEFVYIVVHSPLANCQFYTGTVMADSIVRARLWWIEESEVPKSPDDVVSLALHFLSFESVTPRKDAIH